MILGKGKYSLYIQSTGKSGDVAVKQLPYYQVNVRLDFKVFKIDHPNVVKLLDIKDSIDIRSYKYFTVELYHCNLEDFCNKDFEDDPEKRKLFPSDGDVLFQIASGLEHIHSLKLVHQNINPKNVLVFIGAERVKFSISDFGFSRPSSEDSLIFKSRQENVEPLNCYCSPESIITLKTTFLNILSLHFGKESADVFSLGCTLFYYLSRGYHPFSAIKNAMHRDVVDNILSNKLFLSHLDNNHGMYKSVIQDMIHRDANKRPEMFDVKKQLDCLNRSALKYIIELPYCRPLKK